jgi:hypothetical protein
MRVSFLPDSHEAFILNNSAQPCRKASITLQLFPALKCFPKGALNCVFGITQVAHYQRCTLHERAAMTLNEFVESVDICIPYGCRRFLSEILKGSDLVQPTGIAPRAREGEAMER